MNAVSAPVDRWRPWMWWLVVLALAGVAWVVQAWRGPKVGVREVVRRDYVQSVVASGRVQAPNRVDVGAQVTGTVVDVPVEPGQRVRAGTVLVALQSAEAQALERQARLAVVQAEARLRQLREVQAPVAEQGLRQARATFDTARANRERSEALFKQGFVGEAALEEARKAEALAAAQRLSAATQLETARPSGSDYALAEAALAQAEAGLQAAQARMRYTRVLAPRDGLLIDRHVEVGDVVQPGKALMTLSPEGETQLVVDIDERHLAQLRVGLPALASADAFADQRFEARLAYINPAVNAQTGAVQIKLDVPKPPAYLRQDMTVSVDIQVARHPQALVVSQDVLHEAESPHPWVLRVESGQARRQAVRLGLRGGGLAEVLEGLDAGDLLVPAGEPVREGARLRPQAASSARP